MDETKELSKKAEKKAAQKAEKDAKKADLLAQQTTAAEALATTAKDHTDGCYGYLPPLNNIAYEKPAGTHREFHKVAQLDKSVEGKEVWVRARIQDSRGKGGVTFLVLRHQLWTVQVVVDVKSGLSKEFVKWAAAVPLESIVDVFGPVVDPNMDISATSQKVEIHASKLFCVSKSAELPFQLKDANQPETEDNADAIRVHQDVRLDNRVLDLRTFAAQAAFRVQAAVCFLFRQHLMGEDFIEIHSPKLIGGSSEGGSNVFKFEYFGRPGCLAQSPQLYKQMALCGEYDRVFEIGPVFRAENSNTHRHLCEFTGLDIEMVIKEGYYEVLDVVNGLFKHIFKGLNERCKPELAIIAKHFGVAPFEWTENAPRIPYSEGLEMLKAAGAEIPEDTSCYDLPTEQEKLLGRLVKDKYKTDFYMLVRYPLGIRPFYTMPASDDPKLSNSYDIFMRGEEIISGAQRIHDPDLLTERAKACGLAVETIQSYIDSFKLGAHPHGGVGIGLERVTMLFLGLGNIRKCSLFPRDPKRLAP